MDLFLFNTHIDHDLFDVIQPFLKNIAEKLSILLPKNFNTSDKENFRNKVANELESNLNSVSIFIEINWSIL